MKTATFSTDLLIEAANAEDGWFLISPYGDHANVAGTQRVDDKAATAMANCFTGAISRIKSALGFGHHSLPAYRGHPDDPYFSGTPGHEDFTVYADIKGLEGRADGIYANFAWSNAWHEIKAKLPKLHISPRWAMLEVSNGKGVFRPVKLLSIGLVPHGQIPGTDAVNTQEKPDNNMDKTKLIALLALLGQAITAESTDEQINTALDAAITAKKNTDAELNKAKGDLATANSSLAAANASAKAERVARTGEVITAAVNAGQITAAEKPAWETKLNGAGDFTAAVNELNAQAPAVKTKATVSAADQRTASADANAKFNAAVNAYQSANGVDRNTAWRAVEATPEGKDLLKKMAEQKPQS